MRRVACHPWVCETGAWNRILPANAATQEKNTKGCRLLRLPSRESKTPLQGLALIIEIVNTSIPIVKLETRALCAS